MVKQTIKSSKTKQLPTSKEVKSNTYNSDFAELDWTLRHTKLLRFQSLCWGIFVFMLMYSMDTSKSENSILNSQYAIFGALIIIFAINLSQSNRILLMLIKIEKHLASIENNKK